MKLHTPVPSIAARKGTAMALLLLLFALITAPFLSAQPASHQPSCCMDAQHCSLHLHRATAQQDSQPHLATVEARCPCAMMAPASATTHGAPLLTSALRTTAWHTQAVEQAQAAHRQLKARGNAAAPRAPPSRPANVLLTA